MSDVVLYNHGEIAVAVELCRKFTGDLETLIEEAKAAVEKYSGVSGGEYAESFRLAMGRWDTSQNEINITVGDFAGRLARADENMSATDKSWATKFDALG